MLEIKHIKTPQGEEVVCATCGGDVVWDECYNCEDGYSDHECGEDCCCCINPEPNVICDVCKGLGGWWRCPSCESKSKTSIH